LRVRSHSPVAVVSFAGAVLTAVLAGCGGGSSSSPGVAPIASGSLPPTPASASPDPRPTSAGDTFSYAGSLTEVFTLYGTPAPSPSASATPQPTATPWISTIQQSVSQNVTVSTGVSFASQTGLVDFKTDETDTTVHATTNVTSDDYITFVADPVRVKGQDVVLVGSTSSDSHGVSEQLTNGSGNGVFDILPEVPNSQWTNTASRIATENDPSGQTQTATYAADGSYQENVSYPEGGIAQVLAYPDGSGIYQMPVGGDASNNSSITVNAANNGQIQISYSVYGAGFPQAGGFQIPVWYPQVPPVLANDTYVDKGPASIPSSCNVAPIYTITGGVNEIAETKMRLDTVFGELETDSTTEYVSSAYGVLCTIVRNDLKTYYDYGGQEDAIISFSPTPLTETTVNETLGIRSAHVTAASALRRAAKPSLAGVRTIFALARARQSHAIYTRILSRQRR
jgi:hypothetical protein